MNSLHDPRTPPSGRGSSRMRTRWKTGRPAARRFAAPRCGSCCVLGELDKKSRKPAAADVRGSGASRTQRQRHQRGSPALAGECGSPLPLCASRTDRKRQGLAHSGTFSRLRHEPGRDALPRVLADRQVSPTWFMGRRTRVAETPRRLSANRRCRQRRNYWRAGVLRIGRTHSATTRRRRHPDFKSTKLLSPKLAVGKDSEAEERIERVCAPGCVWSGAVPEDRPHKLHQVVLTSYPVFPCQTHAPAGNARPPRSCMPLQGFIGCQRTGLRRKYRRGNADGNGAALQPGGGVGRQAEPVWNQPVTRQPWPCARPAPGAACSAECPAQTA